MVKNSNLHVELVYVPANQKIIHLQLTLCVGATIADALDASGVLKTHPETQDMPIGVFGERVALTHLVKSGDRIELYRPLLIDPKEKRRERAKKMRINE